MKNEKLRVLRTDYNLYHTVGTALAAVRYRLSCVKGAVVFWATKNDWGIVTKSHKNNLTILQFRSAQHLPLHKGGLVLQTISFDESRRDRACPCPKSAKVGNGNTVGRGLAPAVFSTIRARSKWIMKNEEWSMKNCGCFARIIIYIIP